MHRVLHSFPTRRSSDLSCAMPCLPLKIGQRGVKCRDSAITGKSLRSEEHTSELQSLRHLVCRLLLEKKKKRVKAASFAYTSTAMPILTGTVVTAEGVLH